LATIVRDQLRRRALQAIADLVRADVVTWDCTELAALESALRAKQALRPRAR
jgi:hypothetical protein